MNQYTNYCTEEQMRRAHRLGAPLDKFDPDNSNGVICDGVLVAIPTTQQMMGWLREKGVFIFINNLCDKYEWVMDYSEDCNIGGCDTYEQAELAAIDAALGYLENRENK